MYVYYFGFYPAVFLASYFPFLSGPPTDANEVHPVGRAQRSRASYFPFLIGAPNGRQRSASGGERRKRKPPQLAAQVHLGEPFPTTKVLQKCEPTQKVSPQIYLLTKKRLQPRKS